MSLREVVIPAAGRGARLDRPNTPKPLVQVGGKPMILRLLGQLQESGVEKAVVVAGYEAKKIARAVACDLSLQMKVEIVENKDWEASMAGSLLAAKDHVEGDFLVAMADHIYDRVLIQKALQVVVSEGKVVCMADDRPDSVFDLDSAVKIRERDGLVEAVGKAITDFNLVDCGLYAAGPVLFEELFKAREQVRCAELTDAVVRLMVRGCLEISRCDGGAWYDVDTPADLVHAEMRVRESQRLSGVLRPPSSSNGSRVESRYQMSFGRETETEILVGHGFVQSPLSIPIVSERASASPVFVFSDETVNQLYGRDLVNTLCDAGYHVKSIVLPDGEESKSMANYLYLVERVLSRGVDERSVLVSLGGGVPCNVCGFVASTMYRGLDLVHLPTSLMAQCDAAISHKQGINGARGKNLVGSYFPPRLIAVDVDVLSTLSPGLVADGLSEVVKHALGQDAEFFASLIEYDGAADDPVFLKTVVKRNIQLKCQLTRDDPKEEREGMVLQYGHTVGHPVEHLSGYRLSHGQSVAIGMMVAARVSHLMGACSVELVSLHKQILRRFGLPFEVPGDIRVSDVIDALKFNKKYLSEGTRMALLRDVGRLWAVDGDYAIPVSDDVIYRAVEMSREDSQWDSDVQWSRVQTVA